MVYTRRTWANAPATTTPITASSLNNIEDGVEEATDAVRGRLSETNLGNTIGAQIETALGGASLEGYVRGVYSETVPEDLPENGIWFTTRVDTTPPSIPADLDATPTMLGIDLSWSASTDDSGAISEYRIYRDGVLLTTSLTTTHSDTSAVWGTEYDYTVTAVDPFENESDPSTVVTAVRGVVGEPSIPQTNLVAHFRASDLAMAGVTDGATVATWENRVADGADLIAAGAPAYETGGTRPSIVFDGVDDTMNAAIGTLAQPTVRIAVFKLRTAAASKVIVGTTQNGANRQLMSVNDAATFFGVFAENVTQNSTGAVNTNLHVMATRFDGASTRIIVDGNENTPAATPGSASGNGLRLALNSSGSSFTHVEICEVIVYSGTMTNGDMTTLVSSLRTWYGV